MGISIKGKGKAIARERRHFRLRKKISGTAARPRLVVTRSARHMVAQVVDDTLGTTIVSASTLEADLRALKVCATHRCARLHPGCQQAG